MSTELTISGVGELEHKVAAAVVSGLSVAQIATRMALTRAETNRIVQRSNVQRAIRTIESAVDRQRKFTRDMAHDMYMEAYAMSVEPKDMVNATDALVKLHQLVPQGGRGPSMGVQVNVGDRQQVEVLAEEVPEAELLEAAGRGAGSLAPEAHVHED